MTEPWSCVQRLHGHVGAAGHPSLVASEASSWARGPAEPTLSGTAARPGSKTCSIARLCLAARTAVLPHDCPGVLCTWLGELAGSGSGALPSAMLGRLCLHSRVQPGAGEMRGPGSCLQAQGTHRVSARVTFRLQTGKLQPFLSCRLSEGVCVECEWQPPGTRARS